MRNAYTRNVSTIERLAREILRQCEHYKRNTERGADDSMRVGYVIGAPAEKLLQTVKQARRRWEREHRDA